MKAPPKLFLILRRDTKNTYLQKRKRKSFLKSLNPRTIILRTNLVKSLDQVRARAQAPKPDLRERTLNRVHDPLVQREDRARRPREHCLLLRAEPEERLTRGRARG